MILNEHREQTRAKVLATIGWPVEDRERALAFLSHGDAANDPTGDELLLRILELLPVSQCWPGRTTGRDKGVQS